jgi:hypothetical protein
MVRPSKKKPRFGLGDIDMRATNHLIRELQEEADGAAFTALIVGFENTTLFLYANNEDPLSALNRMIERGGEPFGLMRFMKKGKGAGEFKVRPLAEYAGDPHVERFLRTLLRDFVNGVKTLAN